ncbi:MAG: FxsA family protein [Pseudaminobacter sp.]
MRVSLFPPFLILLPLLEIAGFVVVGRQIGVLPTLGLIIATGIAGGMLLRYQGFGVMTRIRSEIEAGRDPSRNLAHGVMILLAGLLLLIPGFVSDIIGILLFLPPIRDLAWRFLSRRVNFSADFTTMGGFSRQRGGRGKTIDLDEDDYSKSPDPRSPWRQIDDR